VPKRYSSAQISKALLRHGFVFVTQRGSHQKYRLLGQPTRNVIVPAGRREIQVKTLKSILRQADLSEDDLDNVL